MEGAFQPTASVNGRSQAFGATTQTNSSVNRETPGFHHALCDRQKHLRGADTRQLKTQSRSEDLLVRPASLFAIEQRSSLIPAVTYVPTQLPVQYHRLSEA
jgi:hypothetical protein